MATTTDQPWALTPSGPGHWAIDHIWSIIFDILSNWNFHAPFHATPSVRYYEPCSVNCGVVFLYIAFFSERRRCEPADFLRRSYSRYRRKWCRVHISQRKWNYDSRFCRIPTQFTYFATSFPLGGVKRPRTTLEACISVPTVIQAAISLVVQQPQARKAQVVQALLWTQRNSTKNEWCLQKLQWPHFESVSFSVMNDMGSDALHWCHTRR